MRDFVVAGDVEVGGIVVNGAIVVVDVAVEDSTTIAVVVDGVVTEVEVINGC